MIANISHASEATIVGDKNPMAIMPLKGVFPKMLKIDDQSTKKTYCATIVEIIDADLACKTNECLRAFDHKQKKSVTPKAGERAVLVSSCTQEKAFRNFILFGGENIVILEKGRKLERDLWEQRVSKKNRTIYFFTEASSGNLSLRAGQFYWVESE